MPGVTDTLTTIGGGQQQIVNNGTIYVKLSDIGDRENRRREMVGRARAFKNFPPELRTGVQQVQAFSGGGFRNANVQFLISGPDLKKLEEVFGQTARKNENHSRRG
jgi:HAE1 family hydrophobic/amphiphilic exporter-1